MTPFWFIVIGVGFGWLVHSGRLTKLIVIITTPITSTGTRQTLPPTTTNPPSNSA